MSDRVRALRPQLLQATNEARAAKAAELYSLEKLRDAMTKEARAGFDFAEIAAPDGLDLRHTPAALAAVQWLGEQNFQTSWEARAGASGGDGATSYSLRISWKPPALKT